MSERRTFIKQTAIATAGLGLGLHRLPSRYALGANERVRVAVIGVNSRGAVLADTFAQMANTEVATICDVDKRAIERVRSSVEKHAKKKPAGEVDFRRILDDRTIDAIVIATPDHWHAPMSILGLEAGKHVYVEKPCSHNPYEGELLVAAQKKHGKLVQMGTQQRSSLTTQEAIKKIHDGVIGNAYFGKAWYVNNRGPIGNGKVAPVPEWLDYELWQGPAPRRPYKDNLIHYNWHWFWHWGTGELLNNGTHEIDLCRWALQVDYPTEVTSGGGRYHFDDDWECPDTQNVSYEYGGDKLITWEGRSCNGLNIYERGRGAAIYGTEGTIIMDRNGYLHYDKAGKLVLEAKETAQSVTMDTAGGGHLDFQHIDNFIKGIRESERLNSPIDNANTTVSLCHLGNIAQRTGRVLRTDPKTGHVLNDDAAAALWRREYAAGWEPKV